MGDIAELERQVDTVNTQIATRAAPKDRSAVRAGAAVGLPAVPPGTALVSYWLGSESAYAWVLLPKELHWVRLPPPAEINEGAEALRRSLTRLVDTPVAQRLDDARALYERALRPIAAWVTGVRQWVVIPDGALDYVPFAALRGTDWRYVGLRRTAT